MAGIHPSRQSQSRLRSASDPFTDPAAAARHTKQHPSHPPPPPHNSHRMPAAVHSSRNSSQNDIVDAVRDTVQLRSDPRAKVSRTQTAMSPTSASRPSGKRSQSEDTTYISEKARSPAPPAKSRSSKKGSQHADVIDRLDFTGVGPMFHHDGPFDACAPSRNKHRNKAPMYAYGQDDAPAPRYGDSAYPAPGAYKAFTNDYPDPPKKKVDAIAEAWGIHEPEPFEEFFAGGGSARPDGDTPASSIYNGKERNLPASSSRRPTKDTRDSREGRPHVAARRSLVPPPQPIFVADADMMDPPTGSPPATSPGFPKRSKSIMQRFRKMRDSPNVPVSSTDYDYEHQAPPPQSPPLPAEYANGNRPTHKSQNSFLGRLAGGNRPNQSPQGEVTPSAEPFVFIDAHTNRDNNKDLPPPPQMNEEPSTSGEGYIDNSQSNGLGSPGGGGGLGRKTSLMKKVGRVVRGTK